MNTVKYFFNKIPFLLIKLELAIKFFASRFFIS